MINIKDIKDKHGVEIALIILVCRLHFKTATKSQVEAYIDHNTIQWELFLRSCSLHRIRPIVYKALLHISIPVDIKKLIKQELVSLAALSWNLAVETERIIILLKAHNINVLPYKGSAFSKQFYGDTTSRESSDIDLVIQKEDTDAVIRIMENDGYLTDYKSYNYLGPQYFEEYKDLCFNKYKNRMRLFHVEFHWKIAERFFSLDKQVKNLLVNQGNKVTILREPVFSLTIDQHFVAQMINHVWRDLLKDIKALIDIGTCIQDRAGALNWVEINQYVKSLRLKNGFDLSFIITDQLLGVKNNQYASSTVRDKVIDHLKNHSLRLIPIGRIPLRSRMFLICQLSLRETKHDQLAFVSEFLRHCFYPTENDFEIIKLPKQLFFIYPFMKPIRFLFKRTDPIKRKKKLVPDE